LCQPTNTGADTRFVVWKLMTTDRTIGYQEKTPNTSSSGSRKTMVVMPPERTQRRSGRRRERLAAAEVCFAGARVGAVEVDVIGSLIS
jgi:hypothetical protein